MYLRSWWILSYAAILVHTFLHFFQSAAPQPLHQFLVCFVSLWLLNLHWNFRFRISLELRASTLSFPICVGQGTAAAVVRRNGRRPCPLFARFTSQLAPNRSSLPKRLKASRNSRVTIPLHKPYVLWPLRSIRRYFHHKKVFRSNSPFCILPSAFCLSTSIRLAATSTLPIAPVRLLIAGFGTVARSPLEGF